jgi:hypothetical protein
MMGFQTSPMLEEQQLTKQNKFEYSKDISNLIKKVRTIVEIFRKSLAKNVMFLQKHINEESQRHKSLIKDVPTRWNSLFSMFQQISQLKVCILKAPINMKSDIPISHAEFLLNDNLVCVLPPVIIPVDLLCRRDVTLLSAVVGLKFLGKKLEDFSTKFVLNFKN